MSVVIEQVMISRMGNSNRESVLSVADYFPADPAWPISFERGKSYPFRYSMLGFDVFFTAKFIGENFQTDQGSVKVQLNGGVTCQ